MSCCWSWLPASETSSAHKRQVTRACAAARQCSATLSSVGGRKQAPQDLHNNNKLVYSTEKKIKRGGGGSCRSKRCHTAFGSGSRGKKIKKNMWKTVLFSYGIFFLIFTKPKNSTNYRYIKNVFFFMNTGSIFDFLF
jgi:hypothetical protein